MSGSAVWLLVGLCALTTLVAKGLGPLVTGARELPEPVVRVVVLLGSALLTALVMTNALADGGRLGIGADTAGVAVAAVLAWRRAHVVVVMVAAAAVTAGLRAVGIG